LKKLQKKKSRLLRQREHSTLPSSLHWPAGNNEHRAQTGIYTTDWIPRHVRTLRMRREMVLETLVCPPFNLLT